MLSAAEHLLSSMLLSISSMLRTAVQQRRKRVRKRRKRRALYDRQRQQQPIERRRKLRCAAQPVGDARCVVCEDVERDRGQHRRSCDPRRQPLTSRVWERSERQRQIRKFNPDRRQPAGDVAARRRKRALDAERGRSAQQQHCKRR